MSAAKNKVGRHHKLMAVSALPLNGSVHIGDFISKALAASESCSLFEVVKSERIEVLCFIITVIKNSDLCRVILGTVNLNLFPIGADCIPFFH